MANKNGQPPDPDDFFAETRMSFGDHIEDLRTHLWRAIKGFAIALFVAFFFGHHVVRWITAPVKDQLEKFYERRARKLLGQEGMDPGLKRANRRTPFRAVLVPRKQWEAKSADEANKVLRPRIVSAR